MVHTVTLAALFIQSPFPFYTVGFEGYELLGILVRIATFWGPLTNVRNCPKVPSPPHWQMISCQDDILHYCTLTCQCSTRECLFEPYS
jgi:hypothetical protein